jgi:hypothetical protein
MGTKQRILLIALLASGFAGHAIADETMTGDQLSDLLAGGKTIMLGGPGTGYSGELVLTADGKGKGGAKTDDGSKTFVIEGTWEIRDDKFCRTWAEISKGKEVCETWIIVAPNKVKVMDGDKQIGVNYWE